MQLNNETCLPSESEIAELKDKWISYSNDIVSKLEQDPQQFYPAIQTSLNNVDKYAHTTTALLSGMHTAFKYKGISSKNRTSAIATRRKGNKIPIQPTSVARRKMGGKNTFSERKSFRHSGKKIAAHSLKICVEKNVNLGLGGNKFRK